MNNSPLIRKKKIILAEAQDIITDILPRLLKPIGYEVLIAKDGPCAFEMIKEELPDIIIADSELEGFDGFTLCKMLKNDFLTSYIPFILLVEKRQIRKKLLEIKEGVDDYIFKPPDPIDLQVRLEMALRRTDHQVHANSLTRLPGNRSIESTSRALLSKKEPFSFLYLDIDNFKSFNDTYGYLRGDGVIMQTARILADTVKRFGKEGDFVGHVGGDDFVIMTNPEREKTIAQNIIKEFDRLIPLHYSKEDRMLGFLRVKDRRDNNIKAPLMSISVAIVNNKSRDLNSLLEVTEIASEIKKHLKTVQGSKYLINRRSLEVSKISRLENNDDESLDKHDSSGDTLPIGQLLLKARLIDEDQLTEALFEHWSSRQLLGQTLVKMGLISNRDLAPFIEKFQKK